jgi:cell division protein FtsI/penicillin-binding protein 2
LTSEALLADTGFGQGEILISPLHLAMMYGSLASNGNIMLPVLEIKNEFSPKVWKEQAIASKDVPLLIEYLRQVVDNPAGTGYTQPSTKTKILGKTGTAELKKSLSDTTAEENGWFVAMNVEQPRLVVAMLIEDVKNRHGSHYVVPLVKKVMDALLQ